MITEIPTSKTNAAVGVMAVVVIDGIALALPTLLLRSLPWYAAVTFLTVIILSAVAIWRVRRRAWRHLQLRALQSRVLVTRLARRLVQPAPIPVARPDTAGHARTALETP